MSKQKSESKLMKALFPDENEQYKNHVLHNLWTVNEFAALVRGLVPTRFEELIKSDKRPTDPKEEKEAIEALKLSTRFFEYCTKESPDESIFLGKGFYLSPWKFIKWLVENNIPCKNKFLNELPLYLLELIDEFEPINTDLRTAYKYSPKYHRAKFLKHAESLKKRAFPQRLSRVAIYNDPSSQNLLREFKDSKSKSTWVSGKRTHLDRRILIGLLIFVTSFQPLIRQQFV